MRTRDIVCRDCGTEMVAEERELLYYWDKEPEFCCCQCGSTELDTIYSVYKIPNTLMIELDESIEATERMIEELK